MALIITDCPRCDAGAMTFEVLEHLFLGQEYGWQNAYELFCKCRACDRSTTFVARQSLKGREQYRALSESLSQNPSLVMRIDGSLNRVLDIERFLSVRDIASIRPPEHLPPDIDSAFKEAASCYAIGCYNASAAMFRLCLDLASKPLLPAPDDDARPQPNSRQRRDLGLRLAWLFGQARIPKDLEELAACVREDGNDGVHAGNLSKHDLDDLVDFTTALLERLITEPKKVSLAKDRRRQRRGEES